MNGHAVVVGASIGGLVTARVLSRHYSRVTVLERDTLVGGGEPRRGVPQGAHGHILLVSGLRALDELFPGFIDELMAMGGTRFDPGLEMATWRFGRRWDPARTGLDLVSLSRPRLEEAIRVRATSEAGVTLRDRVSVTALIGGPEGVTGVTLDTGEKIGADLVVDAGGRGSRSDRWLGALGFAAPKQAEIRVGVAYSTRLYRRRAGDLPGYAAAFILPTPPLETGAALCLPIDGDRWLISAGGWHVDEPPVDPESFLAYLRGLPDPVVAQVAQRAEPLTDPAVIRFPSSRRRFFEKLPSPPAGFVALGDAICSFNPVYGQGMTCATREAVTLGEVLGRHGQATSAMARDYYGAVAAVIATPWQFAVGGDFAFPRTTGPRPKGLTLSKWYSRRLTYASQIDPEICARFIAVQQLVEPASVLFAPGVVARVLRQARQRNRRMRLQARQDGTSMTSGAS